MISSSDHPSFIRNSIELIVNLCPFPRAFFCNCLATSLLVFFFSLLPYVARNLSTVSLKQSSHNKLPVTTTLCVPTLHLMQLRLFLRFINHPSNQKSPSKQMDFSNHLLFCKLIIYR